MGDWEERIWVNNDVFLMKNEQNLAKTTKNGLK